MARIFYTDKNLLNCTTIILQEKNHPGDNNDLYTSQACNDQPDAFHFRSYL